MTKRSWVYLLFVLACNSSVGQNIIPLYLGVIPNQVESNEAERLTHDDIIWIENVQVPTLEAYLPKKRSATGMSVIICPGGGYQGLAYDWEGTEIAEWFNTKGIAAFVLKYRLPRSRSLAVGHKAPLQDAQRAMKIVRGNADKWNLSKDKIGVMGFSAGGHLASTLGVHFDKDYDNYKDELSSVSARPDFMLLIYPVISTTSSYMHQGSRDNLIGLNPTRELVNFYSSELHISTNTPPAFLVHSSDDLVVPSMNSILLYEALQEKEIYSEMHIYPSGGHGYGLAVGQGHIEGWPDRLDEWLSSLK